MKRGDLGTSTDRAMYQGPLERNQDQDDQQSKDHQQRRDEQEQQYTGGSTREAGGITNRDLTAEQKQQQAVSDRGKTRDKE